MTAGLVLLHVPETDPAEVLREIQAMALLWPGDYTLAVRVREVTIALGPEWTVDVSPEAVAALEAFGRVEVLEA